MNKIAVLTLVVFCASAGLARAQYEMGQYKRPQSQPAATSKIGGIVTVSGTVDAIDYTTRMVTIKVDENNALILRVSDSVKNLDQVKNGDKVSVGYYDSAVLAVHRSEEAPTVEDTETIDVPLSEEDSGVVTLRKIQIPATVITINYATRVMTLRSNENKDFTFTAGQDMKTFERIRMGDTVIVQVTEPLLVSLDKS